MPVGASGNSAVFTYHIPKLVPFGSDPFVFLLNKQSIGPWAIRFHYAASGDRGLAEKLAEHFWPDEAFDAIIDHAAETAGVMCCLPAVWQAITDVANYLLDHGRHQSSIYEKSMIVRNRILQNIPTPFLEWAVSQRRRQP